MRILTMGCGHIGSVLTKDLAENMPLARIVISDSDLNRAEKAADSIEKEGVESIQLDASEYPRLVSTLKDFDLAVGLAPGRMGYQTVRACVEAGVDMVDLSFMPEDPLTLHREAQKADVTVIPDCGVAPGISNMLVGRAYSLLDEVEEAIILVGGIPEKPIGPLGYKVTWCVEDLLEEYTRESKIVKHGKVVEEEALNGLELVEFPGVGKLEAFYTDGVRTLHSTIKGVKNMWEKTLRYPGHAEKIKLLRDLGFFGQTKLHGINLSARELTIKLLEENLSLPEISDLLLMNVKVTGSKGESKVMYDYHILDRYDSAGKVTAMARTTAYTASIVVQLLASNEIAEKGVIPPERLGMDERLFNKIITELSKRGIRVSERVVERT
ncbi:MAG: saccharopine dehydrogenase family protein [Candidatus Bathyarchaeota archaeon]|nr:saccharopine dehydrogenase family protein [Candidatus Bathyarchaeota archaeon]MDH5687844.1 saccharopine dehydrogenase family protein [Candidatus Bathyarchaeota archaeon]